MTGPDLLWKPRTWPFFPPGCPARQERGNAPGASVHTEPGERPPVPALPPDVRKPGKSCGNHVVTSQWRCTGAGDGPGTRCHVRPRSRCVGQPMRVAHQKHTGDTGTKVDLPDVSVYNAVVRCGDEHPSLRHAVSGSMLILTRSAAQMGVRRTGASLRQLDREPSTQRGR